MKIMPIYLISTMFITMFILYILYPEPQILIKYPDPCDEISNLYIDDNGVCYRYHRTKIE